MEYTTLEHSADSQAYSQAATATTHPPLHQEISIFNGAKKPKPTGTTLVYPLLTNIREGKWKDWVEKLRQIKIESEKEYKEKKRYLYGVTFSSVVEYRALNLNPKNPKAGPQNLLSITGIIVVDLDSLLNPEEIKEKLGSDPNILFAFISPGEDGLKVGLYNSEIQSVEDHDRFYQAVENYFREAYGLEIDPQCKDLARLCFVSYDPDTYINENACPFPIENWENEPPSIQPPSKYSEGNNGKEKYAQKVLASSCEAIRNAAPGEMHFTRRRHSRLIGGYVASGYISEHQALQALENAVKESGTDNINASLKTIHDGFEHGKREPITLDNAGHARSAPASSQSTAVPARMPSDQELQERARQVLDAKTPCKEFDTSSLPKLIRGYVDEICKSTHSNIIMVVVAVYSMLSGMVGRNVCIAEGKYFQKLYCILWMLVASGSGTFKSTAQKKGTAILRDAEAEIWDKVEGLRKEQQDILEAGDKNKNQQEKELKEIEKEIAQEEAKSPILPNRTTPEGLIKLLSLGQGGVIVSSELGDWLKSMEQTYNKNLKSLFTELFDGDGLRKEHTKGGGYITIKEAFISICGVSALRWIIETIKPEDVSSGFFARFLLFYPPQERTIPPALPEHKDESKKHKIEMDIKSILQDIRNREEPLEMELSQEAEGAFEKIHHAMYDEIKKYPEHSQDILYPYLQRWSPYILKIAMLNQVIIEPGSRVISTEALAGAVSVIEYAIKSTTHLFENELGESENQRKCRMVLEYIAKKGGKAARKDILASKTLRGGAKDYDYILETLQETGQIDVVEKEKKTDREYSIISSV